MKRALFLFAVFTAAATINLFAGNPKPKETEHKRVIKINYDNISGPMNTMFKECIGAGRANEGLRADWQQQLSMVKKECDFKYIRMHGLLTDDMGVYKEDDNGNPEYNFQYIDVLYDFLLSIDIKPFVELSFMPKDLASGDKTVFWWKGNITPPKDYDKWADLIKNLTIHFTERYGEEEVKTWYFEVWNEPNLQNGFWTGTQEDYFKLYDYAAKAVKSVNPEYRVGGPATAGAEWVTELIQHCDKNHIPVDFISTHSYAVTQGFLDQYGQKGTVLSKDKWSISGRVLQNKEEIENSAMPNLELHYTEWSSSYTPRDPIHDSYHQAAFILEKLKQVGDAPNSMSYWVFTDIFEESGVRFTPFHGGFGLLNYQGIKKPAFYTYHFLNKLGNTELQNSDSSSWVCKNNKGDLQALIWDFTNTHPGDSVHNQDYYIRDLPALSKGKITLEVSGIPEGNYLLVSYNVGYKSNDAYGTYYAMGCPKQLTKEQVEIIKQKNNGAPSSVETITVDSSRAFKKELEIRENDVYFLNLLKQ